MQLLFIMALFWLVGLIACLDWMDGANEQTACRINCRTYRHNFQFRLSAFFFPCSLIYERVRRCSSIFLLLLVKKICAQSKKKSWKNCNAMTMMMLFFFVCFLDVIQLILVFLLECFFASSEGGWCLRVDSKMMVSCCPQCTAVISAQLSTASSAQRTIFGQGGRGAERLI